MPNVVKVAGRTNHTDQLSTKKGLHAYSEGKYTQIQAMGCSACQELSTLKKIIIITESSTATHHDSSCKAIRTGQSLHNSSPKQVTPQL